MFKPALLALEDGTVFEGLSIGYDGASSGEVVFNTSMTGYQEILTDPSYAKQIVTLTYPHIGNVGVNQDDAESRKPWVSGLVIRSLSAVASNWRKEASLDDYLKRHKIVAIADIDTRALTRRLRDKGSLKGCIYTEPDQSVDKAIALAKSFSGLEGLDLAQDVTTDVAYPWHDKTLRLDKPEGVPPKNEESFKVVAYDFGLKHNIVRLIKDRNCDITVVPAKTPAEDVIAMKPDGIFLSNGPGDPEPCDYAIKAIKTFLEKDIPLFGICLGYQLLSLASGAQTMKMKVGHHGANHPVQCLDSARVFITSQNHGFAVDESSLPETLKITHRSLFDNTLQGLAHKSKPAFGFQGHPEASPGPHDIEELFDQFIALMQDHRPVYS